MKIYVVTKQMENWEYAMDDWAIAKAFTSKDSAIKYMRERGEEARKNIPDQFINDEYEIRTDESGNCFTVYARMLLDTSWTGYICFSITEVELEGS